MKKCILMFALLVAALLVAVWMEKDRQITSSPDLLVSESHLNNPTFDLLTSDE